jgi:hypothetical protein
MRTHWFKIPAAVLLTALVATALASAQTSGFSVGDRALNQNGSARLPVTVSSPGTLVIRDVRSVPPLATCGPGPRIKQQTLHVAAAGLVDLRVIPVGQAKKKIAAHRAVKVVAQIAFTPDGGTETTAPTSFRLHKVGKPEDTRTVAHAACSPPSG